MNFYKNRTTLRRVAVAMLTGVISSGLAGCGATSSGSSGKTTSHISNITKFSVAEYGVPASPRVTASANVKKGGGRDMVGKPYRVRGKWYVPKEEPGYNKAGLASWYGPNFHGRLTANGEIYDQYHLSAAHPTFPLPSYARVTNKKNGNSVIVRVNDRGPFSHGRIIDVSSKAAELLEMKRDGVAAVRVEYVGRAPLEGNDMSYLLASYQGSRGTAPEDKYGSSGVMLAMNGPQPSASLPGVGGLSAQPAAAVLASASPTRLAASPVMVSSGAGSMAPAFADGPLPAWFALPETGPVLGERPSIPIPVASATPEGFADTGLAYRGDRVTAGVSPFTALLRRKTGLEL